ncbi:Thioesterase/thiol ester dehydrase-isomerase [Ascodesmis nigricans]|uniref:Thioesterase/thiol ester dehydrase-isomerase n=1 Tax=Ascodesmis nigricans TaxID=341454 RepID=A0A4S2MXT5_9PEZI|nr:Thioesterase/thiol ester dehydrase-isomerase [Ascodesmis nigricans]
MLPSTSSLLYSISRSLLLSFGDTLTPNLRLLTATSSPAQVTFTFTVTLALCNALQNLHGGAAALIFDVTTTCAVVPLSKPGFWENAGVTRSLNCSYLRPLPEGSVVTVEARVVQVGRRLVSVVGVMRGEGGEVAVMCEHTKMVVDGEGGRGKL